MPYKTCSQCGENNGVRAHKCKCGHSFPIKGGSNEGASPRNASSHPLYPSPGTWILERTKGLSCPEPPDELPKKRKFTNGECRDHISYEGIGYCIWDYIDSRRIEDPRLAELWQSARDALREIVVYLDE